MLTVESLRYDFLLQNNKHRKPASMWLLFILITIFLVIGIVVYYRVQNPRCGSDFNPNLRTCDAHGQIIVSDTPQGCDPKNEQRFMADLLAFLQYITRIQRANHDRLSDLLRRRFRKVYQGIFLFAIPELLRILPTDFGQNQVTPYGIVSFFTLYGACISDKDAFCESILPSAPILCKAYLSNAAHHPTSCPFHLTDASPHVYIKDINFFNYIGLLGAISVDYNQAIVIFVDLPVQDLHLSYWSFNVYLADSLNPNAVCSPYRQAYAASIVPPLNMYTAVAISHKKFNPLTADSNTKVRGHVRFHIVIALDSTIADAIVSVLPTEDFVHTFTIPCARNTMRIDPSLPNPNHRTPEDRMFDPMVDRLTCFLRITPAIGSTDTQPIQDFIHMRPPYHSNFRVCMVEDSDATISAPFHAPIYPIQISPPTFDSCRTQQTLRAINQHLKSAFSSHGFGIQSLKIRDTVLNIFAPMYRQILNTTMPYKGGYQAIQLAGNAQADNYDANYCLGEGICLTNNDVMMSVAVNHSRLGLCLYNSINIVDINKAFGYASINLDASTPYDFYIVLAGRNHELLVIAEQQVRSALSGYSVKTDCIDLRTGQSADGNIPWCHQLLYVERVYLNMAYASITIPDKVYNLQSLFGKDLHGLHLSPDNDDAWNSLASTTAPLSTSMIKPAYYKITYDEHKTMKVVVFILIVVLLVAITMFLWSKGYLPLG